MNEQPSRTLFVFVQAAGKACALPLAAVIETMRPLPVEPIGGMPNFVHGLSCIRGELLPVVDLGLLLGAEARIASRRYLTVRCGERRFALAVEEVLGTGHLDRAQIEPLPPLLGEAGAGIVASIGRLDRAVLQVLETAHLFSDAQWRAVALEIARRAG